MLPESAIMVRDMGDGLQVVTFYKTAVTNHIVSTGNTYNLDVALTFELGDRRCFRITSSSPRCPKPDEDIAAD